MLKHIVWFGLVSVLAGAVSVCARADETADQWSGRLFGQEIRRLPEVGDPSTTPALIVPPVETLPTPPALALPPVDTLPTPPSEDPLPGDDAASKPVANAPSKLSDVLTVGETFEMEPPEPPPEKLWDGSFNLGLDGSEGNTETFNLLFGFHANRKTNRNVLTLSLNYNKGTSRTVATADRLYFDGRFELLDNNSRWSLFVHETIEYDHFQPFDVRDTTDAGLGCRLIKSENTTLIGRFGSGFSHEYGGPDNGIYVSEAVFGLQFEHQLNKRQKFVGSVEYAPEMTYFLHYRIRTQAAWEVLLDEERNLSMRMGILDRYNSPANGARRNDLDYAMMLMWKF